METLAASELHCNKRLLHGTGGQTTQLLRSEMTTVIRWFTSLHSTSVQGKILWSG